MSALVEQNDMHCSVDEPMIRTWTSFRRRMLKVSSGQNSEDFDRFAKFIQHPKIVKLAQEFIKELCSTCSADCKISPRIFLAGFMIAVHPNDVLEIQEDIKSDLDDSCCSLAQQMMMSVVGPEEMPDAESMLRRIMEFSDVFQAWKRQDHDRLKDQLGKAYFQWKMSENYLVNNMEGAKDREAVETALTAVRQHKSAMERRIVQFGGQAFLDELNSRQIIGVDLDKLIHEAASEIYWKDFERELSQNPPQFYRIIELLSEIHSRLRNLVPSSRADILSRIDSGVDVEFVSQMIHSGVLDGPQFFAVFESICNTISSLDAPIHDETWASWKEEMLQTLHAGGKTWSDILPPMFNNFLKRIDLIESETARLREQLARHSSKP